MSSSSSKIESIYNSSLIVRKINLPYINLSNNISKSIEEIVKTKFEGKCCKEGYIKPDSCKIVNYSSGILKEDKINSTEFSVILELDNRYYWQIITHDESQNQSKSSIFSFQTN